MSFSATESQTGTGVFVRFYLYARLVNVAGAMRAAPAAVGHLDADCFYVSAERARDPFLVGKPVGVLGNQGACVIAKSYEMKAAGVQTGMPIWEAVAKWPPGVVLQRDFRWDEALSRRM